MMPYNHTKFRVKTHQGAGSVGKKVPQYRKSGKVKPGRGGGGYKSGRPLGDMSTYLRQHRRDIAQTFMADGPGDNVQTHQVSG